MKEVSVGSTYSPIRSVFKYNYDLSYRDTYERNSNHGDTSLNSSFVKEVKHKKRREKNPFQLRVISQKGDSNISFGIGSLTPERKRDANGFLANEKARGMSQQRGTTKRFFPRERSVNLRGDSQRDHSMSKFGEHFANLKPKKNEENNTFKNDDKNY